MEPVVPVHQSPDDVEAEPGALAHGLRGEERIEDPALHLRGYPRPVVGHPHHDLRLPRRAPSPSPARSRSPRRARCRSGSPTPDSARRRNRERAGDPPARPAPATPTSSRAFAAITASVSRESLRDVHRLGRGRAVHVGEALHRAHQLVHPRGRPLDIARQPADRAPGRHPAERRAKLIAIDRRRQLVEQCERDVGLGERRGERIVQRRDPAASR